MIFKQFYWNALTYFSTTSLWRWLARNVLAHMTFRLWGYPKFEMSKYYEIERIMLEDPEAMYVFVGVDEQSLSWKMNNLVTGCAWSHGGFVKMGSNHGEPHVIQMIGHGFDQSTSLLDYLRQLDHFAFMKIDFINPAAKVQAEKRRDLIIMNAANLEYDFELTLNLDQTLEWLDAKAPMPSTKIKFYCTEFVYAVVHGLSSNPNFKASEVAGRLAFEPDDLYHAASVIFEA